MAAHTPRFPVAAALNGEEIVMEFAAARARARARLRSGTKLLAWVVLLLVIGGTIAMAISLLGCHAHFHLPDIKFGGDETTSATTTTRPVADDPMDQVVQEMLR